MNRVLLAAAALLALAGVAHAQPISYQRGARFSPVTASPFGSSIPGVWVKTSDGNLYFRNAAGSDYQLSVSGGGGALPLSGGTMTGPITFSGTQLGPYTLGGTPTYLLSQPLALATAQTVYWTLENTTAAANGAQQNSPAMQLCGRGWGTGGGTSQQTCMALRVAPQQAAAPDPRLTIASVVNGSPTDLMYIHSYLNVGVPTVSGVGGLNLEQAGGTSYVSIGSSSVSIGGALNPAGDKNTPLGAATAGWLRLILRGVSQISTNIVTSAGWGATCSGNSACVSSVSGDDNHGSFVVTGAGGTYSADPTIAITWKDGTWTNAPWCRVKFEATNDATGFQGGLAGSCTTVDCTLANPVTIATSATVGTITYHGTPGAHTYTFSYECTGG